MTSYKKTCIKRTNAVNLIQRRGRGGGGGAEEKERRAGEKVGVRGGEETSGTRKRSKRKEEEEGVTFEVMITKIIIIFVYSQLFWPNGLKSYIFSYLRIFLLG